MESNSVAKKLDALVKLQSIDTKLDQLKKLRGDLPEEVQDLEDELEGYDTRLKRFERELEDLEKNVTDSRAGIKTAEKLITKYGEQQKNVRNNREYDAITKEIELQELEIQILEKKIKESGLSIQQKKEDIVALKMQIGARESDLESRKKELDNILADSQEEEARLLIEKNKAAKKIEDKLLSYYNKLRVNLSNGLAVVSVKRGAAEGCNIVIPPQKIAEIKEKKKIVIDEHSGRILADVDVEVVEEEKPKRVSRRRKVS